MIVVLENEDTADVMKDPYMGKNLTSRGYTLNNMNGVWHPSQPNYIAMISGSIHFPLVLTDNDVTLKGKTIVDLLEPKGLTWKSYQEDYTGTCNMASTLGGAHHYARKHNPFISFSSITSNPARCANIVNSAQLDTDAAAGNLPNYMFYTPNLNNDGHDTDIPTASAWLQGFLEPKLADPAYADTLFVITFDESKTYLGDAIYTVLLGKGITGAGKTDSTKYDHYSILATIEKNFNLGNLGASDKSAATIPLNYPPCVQQNIKNMVVIAFENRAFDNILGYWARTRTGVDAIPSDARQFCTQNGQYIPVTDGATNVQVAGPEHGVDAVTVQIYGPGVMTNATAGLTPTMSGFCSAYPQSADPAILAGVVDGFNPSKVPIFSTLAEEFAVFDRWFAGVPGPTIPNRLFLMSATSTNGPVIHTNDAVADDINGFPQRSIFGNLDASSIPWRVYFSEIPVPVIFKDTRTPQGLSRMKPMSQFFTDAASGSLPSFTWLDPKYANGKTVTDVFGQPDDGSPQSDFARAEDLLKRVYEALRSSPQWNETLLLVTFDEHGGTYDHVPPPVGVPSPDDTSAASTYFKFDRLGVRLPTLAISPWIQKGTVIHRPNGPRPNSEFEHSSVSATIKNIFNLPNFLSKRDAWAGTFDEYTRILGAPRTDCPTKLPDAMPFNVTDSGVVPDLGAGNLLKLLADVALVFGDVAGSA
ncbi:hypothetical protein HK101_010162 [Irineochytrium annulatum]|nr:hypothetical protein HK101_010162 [Irineochytrium annulatum]